MWGTFMVVGQHGDSWWNRNWKWVVAVLILAAVLFVILGVLLVAGGVYLFFSFFEGAFKSSGGYQEALTVARADPAAVRALGTPIEDGWFPTGHVESGGTGGTSDLAIPVSGPRGSGTLYARAVSEMGQWRLTLLVLKVDGTGERIDLLSGRAP